MTIILIFLFLVKTIYCQNSIFLTRQVNSSVRFYSSEPSFWLTENKTINNTIIEYVFTKTSVRITHIDTRRHRTNIYPIALDSIDCSSTSYKASFFSNSTPIPTIKLNQTVLFFCSIDYFSYVYFDDFPFLKLESKNISIFPSYFLSKKKAILSFNYTAPNDLKKAFTEHESLIFCETQLKNYWRKKNEIKIFDKSFSSAKCLFRINIDFEPFIDLDVQTNITKTYGEIDGVECPIRANSFYDLEWLIEDAHNRVIFNTKIIYKKKHAYLKLNDSLLESSVLFIKCVLIRQNLPILKSVINLHIYKNNYEYCIVICSLFSIYLKIYFMFIICCLIFKIYERNFQ